MKSGAFRLSILLLGLLAILIIVGTMPDEVSAEPDGFITFENGTDGAIISSTIPGLKFTNTDGYDWLYADCSTGNYNCPYPDGPYTVNGNIGAWLGTDQGNGQIDFTQGGATYLSVWVSAGEDVMLTAYYGNGKVADSASMGANTNTGRMTNLRVEAPPGDIFHYAIISGVGNYWVMDDLSTDADGVPNQRNPLILLPGITGSKLENDHNDDGIYDEVWPNTLELVVDNDDDSLLVLRLAANGIDPLKNESAYTSIRVGDIIRKEVKDFYESTIEYYTSNGYTEGEDFFPCPFDWRRGLDQIANTLDACIDDALEKNPKATQVNILAHSMGGLVTRQYISHPDRAKNVERLVTLGTPYLGAPKLAVAIIDELCFFEKAGYCITNSTTLKEIAINLPGAYQVAPYDDYFKVYENGYIRIDRDTDGDGRNDGYLDEKDSLDRLGAYNHELAKQARDLFASIGGWDNGGTNGVEVYMMVGDGYDAIGTIVEYNKTPWYNPWGTEVVYKTEVTNGDGTVPVRSADTRNLAAGVNLSDDATVYYYHLKHDELAANYEVLQFAGAIFAGSSTTGDMQSYYGSDHGDTFAPTGQSSQPANRQPNGIAATPRTEPMPLNGRYITLDGPAGVEVFDHLGNRIGAIDDGGGYEVEIPGASLYELANSTAVFLPDSGQYEIKILGKLEAATDVRIQNITSDQLTKTALYDDLPLTTKSVASLNYDPNAATPGSFNLDQDGNGSNESTFPLTEILDGDESQDSIPPESTITVSGKHSSDGWYVGNATVTINAEDNTGGTGVAKIEYTLDEGATVKSYTGPFTINADKVKTIFAKATDRAGNEESPLSFAGVRRIFLPAVLGVK